MPPRSRNPHAKKKFDSAGRKAFNSPPRESPSEAPYGYTSPLARREQKASPSPTGNRPRPKALPTTPAQRPKHLIVDGYNLIHSHPTLKKLLQQFGTDVARDELIKAIALLHDYDGWRLTVVFDGQGGAMSIEYPLKHKTFGCVFSPGGISADEVIQGLTEKCVVRDDLVVATSDGGIRVFIQTQGARWMAPEEFWRWVEETGGLMRRSLGRQF